MLPAFQVAQHTEWRSPEREASSSLSVLHRKQVVTALGAVLQGANTHTEASAGSGVVLGVGVSASTSGSVYHALARLEQ